MLIKTYRVGPTAIEYAKSRIYGGRVWPLMFKKDDDGVFYKATLIYERHIGWLDISQDRIQEVIDLNKHLTFLFYKDGAAWFRVKHCIGTFQI